MIRIEQVSKSFESPDGPIDVLHEVSFDIAPGEIVGIVGANGTGKTTLLRILAGLMPPCSGRVNNTCAGPAHAGLSLVPQKYRESLFPWRTVDGNLHLPFEGAAENVLEPPAIETRIGEALNTLGIGHLRRRRPSILSGGQAQLVAIGRAIVPPWINGMLLDEPFSALDGANMRRAADAIVHITKEKSVATLIITHDIDIGLLISDRIVILSTGRPSIVEILESPSTGELDLALLTRPDFMECKARILKSLVHKGDHECDR